MNMNTNFEQQQNYEQGAMLQEVPQLVSETGLSEDYINEVTPILSVNMMDGLKGVQEWFNDGYIPKPHHYTERFPVSQYQNAVTPQNEAAIAEIDHLADDIAAKLENGSIDQELVTEADRIVKIIRGQLN